MIEPRGSRMDLWTMRERACIGHCFSYENYEPSSRQFRVARAEGAGGGFIRR